MNTATLRIVLSAGIALGASPLPAFAAPPPELKLGQCVDTKISLLGQRLEDESTHTVVADSGSAVEFANGLSQVSYDEVAAVNESRKGDPVSMCLVALPRHCPPGDDRGKVYKTTNLRTHKSWHLSDSEHMCGGA